MVATLSMMEYNFIGCRFTLNYGPFNMKGHAIITIFANCVVSQGCADAHTIGAFNIMKFYYKQLLSFLLDLLIVLST
jgi:hypothetical protein